MAPVVSILVPMRNAEKYITAALDSILCEVDVPLEVIVVDDQSTDDSLKMVQALYDGRVRLIEGAGQGISAAMNVALAEVQGDIIMRCDADDLFTTDRIVKQVSWMKENSRYDALCGGYSTLDTRGQEVTVLNTGDNAADITEDLKNGVTRTSLCTFAIRRSVVEKTGGYRPYFATAEDIDYQLRLSGVSRVMYLPENFYSYRLHDDSITHRQDKQQRAFFEKTARLFQQQRRTTGYDDLDRGHPPVPPAGDFDLPATANDQIVGMLMGRAWLEHGKGRKLNAIRIGIRALLQKPGDFNQWKSFVALILK